jgi:hypothetical protein
MGEARKAALHLPAHPEFARLGCVQMSRTVAPVSDDTIEGGLERARADYDSAVDQLRLARKLLARTEALLDESEELKRRSAGHARRRAREPYSRGVGGSVW